eukprot:6174655-Pleurochrysis_carterae.AAC.2
MRQSLGRLNHREQSVQLRDKRVPQLVPSFQLHHPPQAPRESLRSNTQPKTNAGVLHGGIVRRNTSWLKRSVHLKAICRTQCADFKACVACKRQAHRLLSLKRSLGP